MPGFTLIYQHDGLDKGISERTERLVENSFKIQFISKTEKMFLLFRDGNHYPYEIIETSKYIILIEGRIYDFDPTKDKTFKRNCEILLETKASDELPKAQLEFFQNLDGEFIVYLIDRKGDRIIVLNDFLGRLPQYVFNRKQIILSRDIYVMDKVTTGLLFDESSFYQFLRIGYPLGNRTLYHDIDKLPNSSVVRIEKENICIENTPLSLEEMEGSFKEDKPEEALYELFAQAVKSRMQGEDKAVVSLSGGLDSRVIMGEIEKNGFKTDYASFYYNNPIILNDIEVVKELGRLYNRSPHLTELREWAPESFDEITLAKGGMNYVGMAFIIRFLISLGHTYDLMLTGDGGDKTLPFLFPEIKIKNNRFAKYVLKNNAISSKRTLDSFLLIDVKEQENKIVEYLNNIPGKKTAFKYKNYLVFERTMNWLFEGEDRNRNYLWSTSPFYQPAFFKLVHSIPENLKRKYNLFRVFTQLVDPELNNIRNANWGFPLSDNKQINKMFFRKKIKSKIPFSGGVSMGQLGEHSEMAQLVAALMHKGFGGQIAVYADRHDLNAASSETLFHLITLLKVSEMTWRNV